MLVNFVKLNYIKFNEKNSKIKASILLIFIGKFMRDMFTKYDHMMYLKIIDA